MTKTLETRARTTCVGIAGFKNVRIDDINRFFKDVRWKVKDIHVQFFDAHLIAGQKHLCFAAANALRAFETKSNISSSPAVEALLYASAQRQIKKAVEILGIKPDSSHIAVLIMAENKHAGDAALKTITELIPGERDDDVLEMSNEKVDVIKSLFDISDLEIEASLRKEGLEKEALVNLVIEHMTLLVTKR